MISVFSADGQQSDAGRFCVNGYESATFNLRLELSQRAQSWLPSVLEPNSRQAQLHHARMAAPRRGEQSSEIEVGRENCRSFPPGECENRDVRRIACADFRPVPGRDPLCVRSVSELRRQAHVDDQVHRLPMGLPLRKRATRQKPKRCGCPPLRDTGSRQGFVPASPRRPASQGWCQRSLSVRECTVSHPSPVGRALCDRGRSSVSVCFNGAAVASNAAPLKLNGAAPFRARRCVSRCECLCPKHDFNGAASSWRNKDSGTRFTLTLNHAE